MRQSKPSQATLTTSVSEEPLLEKETTDLRTMKHSIVSSRESSHPSWFSPQTKTTERRFTKLSQNLENLSWTKMLPLNFVALQQTYQTRYTDSVKTHAPSRALTENSPHTQLTTRPQHRDVLAASEDHCTLRGCRIPASWPPAQPPYHSAPPSATRRRP